MDGIKLTIAAILVVNPAFAGEADVTAVKITKASNGTYGFAVSVLHKDEGWDHFANKWEVVAPDGTVLATRVLAHPHVGQLPFTRSTSGVTIPSGVNEVTIRANDSVHGLGGKEMKVIIN
ncbi:MAG: hypothetical protein V3V02_01660 [Rhizobiaceae bacterium]